jgi:hypothetical protein
MILFTQHSLIICSVPCEHNLLIFTSTLGGGSGAICIHIALLPNNKLLCVERPHISPVSFDHLFTHSTWTLPKKKKKKKKKKEM